MRQRPRPACSFRPHSDELEKRTGASVLSIVGLLATSLDAIGQSGAQTPDPAPITPDAGPASPAPRPATTAALPALVSPTAPSPAPVVRFVLVAQVEPAATIAVPSRLAALPIRPLSLPPSQSPTLTSVSPQPRPVNAGSTLGMAAAPAGAGFGINAPSAPVPATSSSDPSNKGYPIIPAGETFGASAPVPPAAPARIAAAQVIAGAVKQSVGNNPSQAMGGYVATGGSSHSMQYAVEPSAVSGGGVTGTSTGTNGGSYSTYGVTVHGVFVPMWLS